MIDALFKEKEELFAKSKTPFLSFSRINKYLYCPEQYRIYYVLRYRLKAPKASLVFGQLIHEALAFHFRSGKEPVRTFSDAWQLLKDMGLKYVRAESWEKFKASGEGLLEKFLKEEMPKIGNVRAAEKVFKLNVTSLGLPLIGVIDLIADVEEKSTVVDFKSAATDYADHEAILSDQLSTYKLAEPEAEQMALCIFIKTKEPRIEWHVADRSGDQLTEYLAKIGYVAGEISAGHFYKRSGKWCTSCDFLPFCLNDKKKIEETLVQVG